METCSLSFDSIYFLIKVECNVTNSKELCEKCWILVGNITWENIRAE